MILMYATSISRAMKIKTFLGPEMATSEASAIWTQKSQDFHTQKNFGTERSIFVCCTEDIYKFVSWSYLFPPSG
jgi:hypothetical protein